MPPRRRTPSTPAVARRPRVAGLTPSADRARDEARDETRDRDAVRPPGAGAVPATLGAGIVRPAARPVDPDSRGVPTPDPAASPDPADVLPADVQPDPQPAGERPAGVPADPPPAPTRAPATRTPRGSGGRTRLLAVALAVAVALAAGLAYADHAVRGTPSAANSALVDVGTTTDVAGQLGSALETVYSYDFTRLDENERLARGVITPEFAAEFDQLFAQVRRLAPEQQAVVSATVTTAAVQSIDGDRAVLVAFLDQQATRANAGAEPQQLAAAGRLTVVGQRDGDTWKIADVVNR